MSQIWSCWWRVEEFDKNVASGAGLPNVLQYPKSNSLCPTILPKSNSHYFTIPKIKFTIFYNTLKNQILNVLQHPQCSQKFLQ